MNNETIQVTPEQTSKVLTALGKEDYKWRTVREVVKETGLDFGVVETVLLKKQDKIVRSSARSSLGENLYTTRKNFNLQATLMEKLIGALKNRID